MTQGADAHPPSSRRAPESPAAYRNDAARAGVVLYVAIDDQQAAASGTTVIELAETLNEFARELVPDAETHAAIALTGDEDKARRLSEIRGCSGKAVQVSVEVDQTSRSRGERREVG